MISRCWVIKNPYVYDEPPAAAFIDEQAARETYDSVYGTRTDEEYTKDCIIELPLFIDEVEGAHDGAE